MEKLCMDYVERWLEYYPVALEDSQKTSVITITDVRDATITPIKAKRRAKIGITTPDKATVQKRKKSSRKAKSKATVPKDNTWQIARIGFDKLTGVTDDQRIGWAKNSQRDKAQSLAYRLTSHYVGLKAKNRDEYLETMLNLHVRWRDKNPLERAAESMFSHVEDSFMSQLTEGQAIDKKAAYRFGSACADYRLRLELERAQEEAEWQVQKAEFEKELAQNEAERARIEAERAKIAAEQARFVQQQAELQAKRRQAALEAARQEEAARQQALLEANRRREMEWYRQAIKQPKQSQQCEKDSDSAQKTNESYQEAERHQEQRSQSHERHGEQYASSFTSGSTYSENTRTQQQTTYSETTFSFNAGSVRTQIRQIFRTIHKFFFS